ncbi:MAG TPA: SDR family oxidoreductase [Arenimonas sp.]|uniref:SDR family oxidoreductase n=1 Tax=Arenimonas sp. TaxID=1872635 RepID=UPI002CEC390F|nr:SDR family oxidoreductase [Arenimonas sp.]HMB55634.1 SDR family oxidoreductase [Arenimonas sp.]
MGNQAFAGKTVLITGAASGIGRGVAMAFAQEGANVVVADIAVAAGEETAKDILRAGGQAIFVRTDVAVAADVKAAVDAAVATYGALDCAFNNAGIEEEHQRLADSDEAMFDRMMAINVKGVWLCMKHEIAQMLKQGGGSIVNTASVAGLIGAPKHAIYAASKHAVVGLTKSAAAEYGKKGIRVNSVCPGVIRTPMLERALEREAGWEESLVRMHPIGRLGEVDDVASAVLWLCSDASSFVTGHQLAVDGAMTVV